MDFLGIGIDYRGMKTDVFNRYDCYLLNKLRRCRNYFTENHDIAGGIIVRIRR